MHRLGKDTVIRVALLFLVVTVLFYTLPILTADQLFLYCESWASPILLMILLWALLQGRREIEHVEERRFWALLATGFFCWLLGALMQIAGESVTGSYWFEPAIDSLFLLSYVACILAVDERPHGESGWSRGSLSYAFSTLGTLLFVCGLILYFFLIPYLIGADSGLPSSWFLIIALDVLLFLRFAYLTLGCNDRWWRAAYGVFAAASALWVVTDSIECAMDMGKIDLPYGTAWDALWFAPFLMIIVLRRSREAVDEVAAAASGLEGMSRKPIWHADTPPLLLLYAFAFPLFHLSMYATGMLEAVSRNLREALVLANLIAFVALAVAQQWLLVKRNRELRSAITVLVSNEQMQQAQKMEAVGRLAGGVAHDFNNLLAVIRGRASLLLSRLPADDRLRSDVMEIAKASQRGADLTRQLLTFSRDHVNQPEVLDLNFVIEESRIMLRRLLGETIQVETALEQELGAIKADPSQLLQIILNLAVNARDAMPEGGKLVISTFNRRLCGKETNLQPPPSPGAYVALAVSDTGCGMDNAVRSRLFEPFFSRRKGGTGLGLATVYGIVQRGDGCLQVESTEGRGTTITAYLPKVEGAPRVVEEAAPEALIDSTGTSTVLLVEDEYEVRETVRELLLETGYEVLEAENAERALAIFREDPMRIDILVTDIVMPGMNGWKLGEALRNLRDDLPVLYMSGYTDGTADGDAELGPLETFVQKPFDIATFSSTIRSLQGEAGASQAG